MPHWRKGSHPCPGLNGRSDRGGCRTRFWRSSRLRPWLDARRKTVPSGSVRGGVETSIAFPKPGDPFYGQDGNYAGSPATYRDNGDGTVSDLVTGLVWLQDPGMKKFYEGAVTGAPGHRTDDGERHVCKGDASGEGDNEQNNRCRGFHGGRLKPCPVFEFHADTI